MYELLFTMLGGFFGGLVRGTVGILKSMRDGKKIKKRYLATTLIASALIGMIAGLFVENDVRFSILAGYVGTDFIEGLYKARFADYKKR